MREFNAALHEPLAEAPAPAARALRIPVIRDLKQRTWYYGVRCVCQRLLALGEDVFAGRGAENLLELRMPIGVQCDCGVVLTTSVLQKFRSP